MWGRTDSIIQTAPLLFGVTVTGAQGIVHHITYLRLKDVRMKCWSIPFLSLRKGFTEAPPQQFQILSMLMLTNSKQVLLKLSKFILHIGDRNPETYAVLDDGSERTILLHSAAKQLRLIGHPENLPLSSVNRDLNVLQGASVTFTISPANQPYKVFKIHDAFTAETLSLAEHTHPVAALQQRYHHLRDLPLQKITAAHPLLLIGSDYPHLITPIEPVRFGPPGGPAAIRTRLGWTLQGPAHEVKHKLSATQCNFTSVPSSTAELYSEVEKLWKLDVLPYRSTKVITRSRQDEEAMSLLESKTVRVEINGVHRYATPMLRVKSMGTLHAPKEATLPLLRNIERRLDKATKQAAAYQAEIKKAGIRLRSEADT